MVQLHAHGPQNRAHRARRASLLADHFAHILRRHLELQDSVFVPVHGLHLNGCWLIHQGPRDLADQFSTATISYLGHATCL